MMYMSFESLRIHFKCEKIIDLLYDPNIVVKISAMRFFYKGRELNISKLNGVYSFINLTSNGEWIRTEVTNDILKNFKILTHEYYDLIGVQYNDLKREEIHHEEINKDEDEDISEDIIKYTFMGALASLIGSYIYLKIKPKR